MNALGKSENIKCEVTSFYKGIKAGQAIISCEISVVVTEDCALKGCKFTKKYRIFDHDETRRKSERDALSSVLESFGVCFESISPNDQVEHSTENNWFLHENIVHSNVFASFSFFEDDDGKVILYINEIKPISE